MCSNLAPGRGTNRNERFHVECARLNASRPTMGLRVVSALLYNTIILKNMKILGKENELPGPPLRELFLKGNHSKSHQIIPRFKQTSDSDTLVKSKTKRSDQCATTEDFSKESGLLDKIHNQVKMIEMLANILTKDSVKFGLSRLDLFLFPNSDRAYNPFLLSSEKLLEAIGHTQKNPCIHQTPWDIVKIVAESSLADTNDSSDELVWQKVLDEFVTNEVFFMSIGGYKSSIRYRNDCKTWSPIMVPEEMLFQAMANISEAAVFRIHANRHQLWDFTVPLSFGETLKYFIFLHDGSNWIQVKKEEPIEKMEGIQYCLSLWSPKKSPARRHPKKKKLDVDVVQIRISQALLKTKILFA